jgi:hypothetical protein
MATVRPVSRQLVTTSLTYGVGREVGTAASSRSAISASTLAARSALMVAE